MLRPRGARLGTAAQSKAPPDRTEIQPTGRQKEIAAPLCFLICVLPYPPVQLYKGEEASLHNVGKSSMKSASQNAAHGDTQGT